MENLLTAKAAGKFSIAEFNMLSNPKRQCALFVHQFDNLVSRQSYVANVQLVNQAIKERVWPLTLTNIVLSRFEALGTY